MAGMIALLEKAAKGKTTAVVDALTEAVREIDEAKKHAEEVVAHRIVAKMGEMVPASDESLGGMSVEAVFKQALESALFKIQEAASLLDISVKPEGAKRKEIEKDPSENVVESNDEKKTDGREKSEKSEKRTRSSKVSKAAD